MLLTKQTFYLCIVLLVLSAVTISCKNALDVQGDKSMVGFDGDKTMLKADPAGISAETQAQLRRIAGVLAIRYVNDRDSTQVDIPEDMVDYFYNGLIHFYKSEIPQARDIVNNYSLITMGLANPQEVLLWVDKSKPWVDNWRKGNTNTGVAEVDELIKKFDLTLDMYREYSIVYPDAMAKMRSTKPLNVYAVGNQFSALDEIQKAGPDMLLTGGRDVQATVEKDYLLLDITVGSGDCPSGCINKINRQFKVFWDGEVTFVK